MAHAATAAFVSFPAMRASIVHRLSLALVWLAIASGAIVFSEPAPFDVLSLGLAVLLPTVGLVAFRPLLGPFLLLMMILAAGALVGVMVARETQVALTHTAVGVYLYVVTFAYALFVAKCPARHAELILKGSLAGAVFAGICGIIGYFDLFPGAAALMTRYSRATGMFKDPNVFGPFLITGFVYAFHLVLTRPLFRALLPGLAFALLALAILLSFSRGAWTNAAIALLVYGLLYVLTVGSRRARMKFAVMLLVGTAAIGCVLAAALQVEAVASLLNQRAALTQGYDEGPDGRFGGQQKAMRLAVDNPLGIGAQQFPLFHHHEEAHNVYISMFMNTGWIGGTTYLILMFGTCVLGLRQAFRKAPAQPFFIIAYGAFVGHVLEGFLIDLDHWRHIYVLLALLWGVIAAAEPAPGRAATG
ncbi:MAG: O-antigen ligase family protein [Hyphomicrobiaceae bacterium]|nr:O-antigen ligase family protein [Hyphomicrobiaceae bacterium]